jgi:MFS family permease
VPAWQAECLKTHRRGTLLLVSFGSCITLGLAISYWMDYAFTYASPPSTSWRAPVGLGMIFMFFPLIIMYWLPESPRYLILTGREQEAKKVFSALNELPPDDEDIHREFLMVKHTLLHMASGPVTLAFQMGEYRYVHRTILAVCLQIMQQFTGVNLFMQYLGGMFVRQLHFPDRMALLLASCCATEFFLASLIAVVGIDRFWGRRTLTMFGAAGMCLCMIVLCVLDYVGTRQTYYAMTAFLFLYVTFFSIGWQGMSWLWAVELIPLCTRGPANALATAANWLSNFVVVMSAPAMFLNITYRTYIVFAITLVTSTSFLRNLLLTLNSNFFIVPAIYFFYPETGYRSLEEVDVLFSEASKKPHPWLAIVPISRKEPQWYDKQGDSSDSYASESGKKTFRGTEKDDHRPSQAGDDTKWTEADNRRATPPASRGRSFDDHEGAEPPPDIRVSPPRRSPSSGGYDRPSTSP